MDSVINLKQHKIVDLMKFFSALNFFFFFGKIVFKQQFTSFAISSIKIEAYTSPYSQASSFATHKYCYFYGYKQGCVYNSIKIKSRRENNNESHNFAKRIHICLSSRRIQFFIIVFVRIVSSILSSSWFTIDI